MTNCLMNKIFHNFMNEIREWRQFKESLDVPSQLIDIRGESFSGAEADVWVRYVVRNDSRCQEILT